MSLSLNHLFVIVPVIVLCMRAVYVDLRPQLSGIALGSAVALGAIVSASVISIVVFAIDVMYV